MIARLASLFLLSLVLVVLIFAIGTLVVTPRKTKAERQQGN
jgi:hypothetical protein